MSQINFDENKVEENRAADEGKSLTERLQNWFGVSELTARRIQIGAGSIMLLVSFYFWIGLF